MPPPPTYSIEALAQCTAALAQVRTEVQWLLEFFSAMVTTARVIVEQHALNLKNDAMILVGPSLGQQINEVARGVCHPSSRACKPGLTGIAEIH